MARFSLALALLTSLFATNAAAQSSDVNVDSASIITTAPAPSASRQVWFQKDMEEANARIRKIRNALIGTSAAFAAGVVIGGIGASQCQVIERPGEDDDILCNTAGNVMLPMGATIAGLSAIGMITTGIMLGVAKKRRRDIERDFRRSFGRRLEWDPRGVLRF
jgi:hypothetical protein